MDKRLIFSLIIITLLFSSCVYAEDYVLPQGELTQSEMILKQAQENILKTSEISTKIDELAQKNVENLEIVAGLILQSMNQKESNLIIMVVLITIACQGLWWAIFLYLQSKSLINPFNQKPKKKSDK